MGFQNLPSFILLVILILFYVLYLIYYNNFTWILIGIEINKKFNNTFHATIK